jgi:hypothetical protein
MPGVAVWRFKRVRLSTLEEVTCRRRYPSAICALDANIFDAERIAHRLQPIGPNGQKKRGSANAGHYQPDFPIWLQQAERRQQ